MNELINETTINDVINKVYESFNDIPFENSDFQNDQFVINAQITPERAYRALGLRLTSRIRSLQEAYFGRKKEEIDIAELQEKINDPETNKWDKMRHELDIQQKLSQRKYTEKLINDCIHECNRLYALYEKMPKYTREQFEAAEKTHYTLRLTRQAQGIQGAHESLLNMSENEVLKLDFDQIKIEMEKQ